VATRQIPFSRLGRRNVRFQRSKVQQWLDEREGVEYHTRPRKQED